MTSTKSFISTATVHNISTNMKNGKPDDELNKSVFEMAESHSTPKSTKRPRICISDSSDHSACIEKELENISRSVEKIVTKEDIEQIVSSIMGQMIDKLKKEIRKEVTDEIDSKMAKLKETYDKRFSNVSRQMEAIEKDNNTFRFKFAIPVNCKSCAAIS